MRCWSSLSVRNTMGFSVFFLNSQRKKRSFGLFLSSSLDKSLVEGKREHPRGSIRLLSDRRTQRFERGKIRVLSLKANLSRKESKVKHSGTRILGRALGREPAVHKQLRSHRGVSCCCKSGAEKGIATCSSTKTQLRQVH